MLSDLLLGSALDHVARGWPVFPLRPGDKRPAIRHWEARATTDPDRIRRAWTARPCNVGVACGRARLVVVDLDTPKECTDIAARWRQPAIVDGSDVLAALADHAGARLPIQTYTVRTASGGQHLYFTPPDGPPLRNTAGRLGWLIDTRAAGGYVVGAGSTIRGHSYTPFLDLPVAPLPPWMTGLLRTPERPPPPVFGPLLTGVEGRSRYAATALRGELERVLAAHPGGRNHALNAAAFALGQLTASGLLPADLASDALAQAAQAIGLPSREAAATIRSGLTAGARSPRRFPVGTRR